jgi:hypothetical protein
MDKNLTTPPQSMVAELSAWNNGKGIDLESWIACSGNFQLAVGYSTIFWPKFVLFEDYIFRDREGLKSEQVRASEADCKRDKRSIEWVFNHLHIADIQYHGCEDLSEDKIMFLGQTLREIWEAKLRWQFPDRPCVVEFYEPEDRNNLVEFQLSFWQKKHEKID